MSDTMTSAEVEDILSSIRRLVSEDTRKENETSAKPADRLVLTPALRVKRPRGAVPPEAAEAVAQVPEPTPFQAPRAVNSDVETVTPDASLDPMPTSFEFREVMPPSEPQDTAEDVSAPTEWDPGAKTVPPRALWTTPAMEAAPAAAKDDATAARDEAPMALDVPQNEDTTIPFADLPEPATPAGFVPETLTDPAPETPEAAQHDAEPERADFPDQEPELSDAPEPEMAVPQEVMAEAVEWPDAEAEADVLVEAGDVAEAQVEPEAMPDVEPVSMSEAEPETVSDVAWETASHSEMTTGPEAFVEPEPEPEPTPDTQYAESEEASDAVDRLDTEAFSSAAEDSHEMPSEEPDAEPDVDVMPEPVMAARAPEASDMKEPVANEASLSNKIAALETLIAKRREGWEPDGAEASDYAGTASPALQWEDAGEAAPEQAETPTPVMVEVAAETQEAEPALSDDPLAGEEALLDEAALRELVADIVREELQGALGERITRNVRKLVRREIHRALAAQDLE